MKITILIAALAIIFYYFVMVKNGNLSFWKKAAKKPDFVYDLLINDEAWLIDDGTTVINKKEVDGPFMLYVPNLGKSVKFYGKIGRYENSQKEIEKNI